MLFLMEYDRASGSIITLKKYDDAATGTVVLHQKEH